MEYKIFRNNKDHGKGAEVKPNFSDRQKAQLLFDFCTYLEETTNIKPFIHKDRIVNRFIRGEY